MKSKVYLKPVMEMVCAISDSLLCGSTSDVGDISSSLEGMSVSSEDW